MAPKKLSERALILLAVIDNHTDRDWTTGEIRLFYVPGVSAVYVTVGGEDRRIFVSGSGDARILTMLRDRGLIERPKTSLRSDFVYAITEDGRRTIEDNRAFYAGGAK